MRFANRVVFLIAHGPRRDGMAVVPAGVVRVPVMVDPCMLVTIVMSTSPFGRMATVMPPAAGQGRAAEYCQNYRCYDGQFE